MKNPFQEIQIKNAVTPAAVNGAVTPIAVDVHGVGAQWVRFVVHSAAHSSVLAAAVSITECDTSGGTYNTFTEGSTATVVSTSSWTAGSIMIYDLEWLGARKRYAKCNFSTGSSIVVGATAHLAGLTNAPQSASDAGAIEWIRAAG